MPFQIPESKNPSKTTPHIQLILTKGDKQDEVTREGTSSSLQHTPFERERERERERDY